MGDNYHPSTYERADKAEQERLDEITRNVSRIINHESSQAPLYYVIAGMWTNLGSIIGISGLSLLYWIRFLNLLFIILLVWFSYLITKKIFPENSFLIYSVPLLIAVLPQDTFYSIQNDVLSPVCFALTFYLLIKFITNTYPKKNDSILIGLTLAATILVKNSNVPLLFIVSVAMFLKARTFWQDKNIKTFVSSLTWYLICLLVPLFIWFYRNSLLQDDFTSSLSKIQHLGWSIKPFSSWFNHPIFSFDGIVFFWEELMKSFWRGELVWLGMRVTIPLIDQFYWVSSFIFLSISILMIRQQSNSQIKQSNRIALWAFLSLILFLIFLSLLFDFGTCSYPSQQVPYFISGRLLSAGLLPFMLLYAQGLDWLTSHFKNRIPKYLLLFSIVFCILYSEVASTFFVFYSKFNWFHS